MLQFTRIPLSAWFSSGVAFTVAAVLLVGAQNIAPPIFDPVGSAAFPRACASGLILLGAALLIDAAFTAPPGAVPSAEQPVRVATVGIFALMLAYLVAMWTGLGFTIATVMFTTVAIPLIAKSTKVLPIAICVALLLGIGSHWLFTSVFFVDLPEFR